MRLQTVWRTASPLLLSVCAVLLLTMVSPSGRYHGGARETLSWDVYWLWFLPVYCVIGTALNWMFWSMVFPPLPRKWIYLTFSIALAVQLAATAAFGPKHTDFRAHLFLTGPLTTLVVVLVFAYIALWHLPRVMLLRPHSQVFAAQPVGRAMDSMVFVAERTKSSARAVDAKDSAAGHVFTSPSGFACLPNGKGEIVCHLVPEVSLLLPEQLRSGASLSDTPPALPASRHVRLPVDDWDDETATASGGDVLVRRLTVDMVAPPLPTGARYSLSAGQHDDATSGTATTVAKPLHVFGASPDSNTLLELNKPVRVAADSPSSRHQRLLPSGTHSESGPADEEDMVVFYPRRQFACMLVVNALLLAGFVTVQQIARLFLQSKAAGRQTLLAFAFQIGASVLRTVLWQVSRLLDPQGAQCEPHHMFVLMINLFAYVFWRQLFSEVSSIGIFVVIQTLSIGFEFVLYYVVITPSVWKVIGGAQETLYYLLCRKRRPLVDLRAREVGKVCVQYALRNVANLVGTLDFVLVTLLLRYVPYLESTFEQTGSNTSSTEFTYIAVAVALEMVLAAVMQQIYQRTLSVSLWATWAVFIFNDRHFYTLLFAAAHVSTDIIVARIHLKF